MFLHVCYQKKKHLPFTSQFSKLHQNWYWFNAHQDTHTCDFIWNESENVLVQWIVGSAWMNTNSRGMIHQSMYTAEMQISFSGMLKVIANLDLIETTTMIIWRYVIAQMKIAKQYIYIIYIQHTYTLVYTVPPWLYPYVRWLSISICCWFNLFFWLEHLPWLSG